MTFGQTNQDKYWKEVFPPAGLDVVELFSGQHVESVEQML